MVVGWNNRNHTVCWAAGKYISQKCKDVVVGQSVAQTMVTNSSHHSHDATCTNLGAVVPGCKTTQIMYKKQWNSTRATNDTASTHKKEKHIKQKQA